MSSYLNENLHELFKYIQNLQQQQENPASYGSFLQQQAVSLLPVWNALQQREFSPAQKKAFDQASSAYLKMLQNLTKQNLPSALKEIEQSVEALTPLTFQENAPLQLASLNYEILLLQDAPTISGLQKLLAQFDQLQVSKEQTKLLNEIKELLKRSLKELQNNQLEGSRFFLLTGLSHVEALVGSKASTPVAILNDALGQASRTLQLFSLKDFMQAKSHQQEDLHEILTQQLQAALEKSLPFIPVVLEEQKKLYHQTGNPNARCQESPWDQVIPFFDRGYQMAKKAAAQFSPLKWEQTVQDWQQALNLLINPPQPNLQPEKSSSSQNLSQTLGLIQEMYLQDQAQPVQEQKELHSW